MHNSVCLTSELRRSSLILCSGLYSLFRLNFFFNNCLRRQKLTNYLAIHFVCPRSHKLTKVCYGRHKKIKFAVCNLQHVFFFLPFKEAKARGQQQRQRNVKTSDMICILYFSSNRVHLSMLISSLFFISAVSLLGNGRTAAWLMCVEQNQSQHRKVP